MSMSSVHVFVYVGCVGFVLIYLFSALAVAMYEVLLVHALNTFACISCVWFLCLSAHCALDVIIDIH